MVAAQPELAGEAERVVADAGAVDADEEETHVPEDDGEIDVGEEGVAGVAMQEPEGDGNGDADEEG